MRARLANVFILAAVLTVASPFAAGRVHADSRQSSRPAAPDFSVTRFSDGRSVSLSDLRGKVVLVFFFFPT